MTITLEKPITFSLVGQRANNEDFVLQVNEQSRLFIVCDGIGGWDRGEVASQLVGESVARYFQQHPQEDLREEYLAAALSSAYLALAGYLQHNPLVNKLGTTLALLYLHGRGATVVHVGDSRVYHLRAGQVLFQTQDHKYVRELVADGIITEAQALTHPRRNTLSRSVGAESGQPLPKMDKPDITHLTDIRAGDCFFLCTDGVLEQIDPRTLEVVFTQNISPAEKVDQILLRCQDKTRDNYSGCLVAVKSVEGAGSGQSHELFSRTLQNNILTQLRNME
ncbi:PP2C family protein-serine/threonine phosphatase [Persicitalea jodogahamensis]|uniref:PPM-type phosphatase domain-containing protein n=1 Tax=Persicitalea jodogahamensis TaxID=402147 RepID=A0A8J3D4G2_9BACT|nr:protein phosphatase 2C domain-containing protein [Persicitalea jodogahamensis]GHB73558.1 hypothetical protein GCM10007390_29620 [Persicitalea jodogahamensis]